MRWRFYLTILSGTAVFCFMLMTAVTDYGMGGKEEHTPLISATLNSVSGLGTARPAAPTRGPAQVENKPAAPGMFPTPSISNIFIPANFDPIQARREEDAADKANRGKPERRKLLKWDDGGWFREEVALVTAYCPCTKCCGSRAAGITSIGKDAWTPGLAADPISIDYDTRVFVPGYGLSVIDDTGGAMRRHWRQNGLLHIDVRMTYHYEARQWGKQYLRVKIYDE